MNSILILFALIAIYTLSRAFKRKMAAKELIPIRISQSTK